MNRIMKRFLPVACLLLATTSPAQTLRQRIAADSAQLAAMYKDLHQNPELGFQEWRTSGIVAKELKALGYEVITGMAKTGVAGILRNGGGPIVMFRADMDCNSVKEITGLPYASTKTMKKDDGTETPVMHACGHDAHVTWLLAIAKQMMALKAQWKGTLILLAQPAEEPMLGAKALAADSIYKNRLPVPDYLLGLHTWPIPTGTIINGMQERMAGSDQLDVTFYGVGVHGSSPENGKDPIVMACNAVMQYQTVVSRQIAAQESAVLTVGAIHAGVDNNVIPAQATVKLNLRWFNEKTRNVLLDGIRRINEGIAVANNLPKEMYPSTNMKSTVFPLVNDEATAQRVNKALTAIIPATDIYDKLPPVMGSEDFQHLVKDNGKTVCDFILVGTAHPDDCARAANEGKKFPYFNHNGNYKVDFNALPLGVEIGVTSLLELFKK
jgi:amidohydrolase